MPERSASGLPGRVILPAAVTALAVLVTAVPVTVARSDDAWQELLSEGRARVVDAAKSADALAGRLLGPDATPGVAADAFSYAPVEVAIPDDLGYGRVLRVGPGLALPSLAAAARVAAPGDIVEIEPGTYRDDVAIWRTDDLLIRGAGGTAHVDGSGAMLAQNKGLWVIQADNVRIENVEFSNAVSPDRNGAGIRAEGDRLHVIHCYFHDNETGILTNPVPGGRILVEHSEFARNGHPDGQAHQFYANAVDEVMLRFNYFHSTRVGSAIKSRASTNRILYNRIVDGGAGTSNYSIDLSEGGEAFVTGNVLQQSQETGNSSLVTFAPEGQRGKSQRLYLSHNTMVSDRHFARFVVNHSSGIGFFYNNFVVGAGVVVSGEFVSAGNMVVGPVPAAIARRSLGSEALPGSNGFAKVAGFRDRARLDYGLTAGSGAIGWGVDIGPSLPSAMLPKHEYQHPLRAAARAPKPRPDAGALAFRNATGFPPAQSHQ